MAIHSLRDSNQEIHNRLRNECDVISALQKLRLQLEKLVNVDDQLEFVVDLQTRCQNLISMFLEDWKNNEETSKSEALPSQLSK
jgi:two-component sensor histidine kinase